MTVAARERNAIDHPSEYLKLSPKQQGIIQRWIEKDLRPHEIKSYRGANSYSLKHIFEDSEGGFYITNGMMKGAFYAAGGFPPNNTHLKNWDYAISIKVFN